MKVYNKAAEMYPNDYRVYNDLGLTQYVAGDYDAARANFSQAARLNPAATEPQMNLGLISLVNKDYSKAKSTLGAVNNPDAMTYYLTAILGARTNNDSMVSSNLRQAVKLDRSLATRALNDLEFKNFNLSAIL